MQVLVKWLLSIRYAINHTQWNKIALLDFKLNKGAAEFLWATVKFCWTTVNHVFIILELLWYTAHQSLQLHVTKV